MRWTRPAWHCRRGSKAGADRRPKLQGRPSGKSSHVRCDAESGSQFRTYRLLKGDTIGNSKFKVHLDRYNQLPYLTGQQPKGERTDFAYYNDNGALVAFRHRDWKAVFCEMKPPGGYIVWYEPFTACVFRSCLTAHEPFRAARHCRLGGLSLAWPLSAWPLPLPVRLLFVL